MKYITAYLVALWGFIKFFGAIYFINAVYSRTSLGADILAYFCVTGAVAVPIKVLLSRK